MNSSRLLGTAIIVLVLLGILSSTVYTVDQRQYAVVYSLGEVTSVVNNPGLHFKMPPPFQNVVFLDRRILTLDTPDADRFITAEKKNLLVDSFVKWRILDPKQFLVSVGGDDRRAQDRLNQIVKAALNEEITKRTVREVVSGERDKVMSAIRTKITDDAQNIGVEVIDVRLKRVDLLPEVSESVYRRMEAERKRVANELRSTGTAEGEKIRADAERQREKILAQAYRQAQIVKGEADAKAAALYAQSFGKHPDFAAFYRSLEAYRATFKNRSDVLVLDANSDFLKYMKSSRGTGK